MGDAVIARVGIRGVLVTVTSLAVLGMPAAAQSPSATLPAVNPYAATGAIPGSGAGLSVGIIAGVGTDPALDLVAAGIAEEAEIAGVEVVTCETGPAAGDPLACARRLRRLGVDGVIAGELEPDVAAAVCTAHGNLPTVAVGPSLPPCGVAVVVSDGHAEGWLAGERVGALVADQRACTIDLVVTLSGPPAGGAAGDRLDGLLEGFESVCGRIPASQVDRLDASGTGSVGAAVAALLAGVPPDGAAVILADADAPALEALAAAEAAGRADAIRIGAVGGTADAFGAIGCHPSWAADATSFPERYGRTLVPAIIDVLTGQDVPALMTFPAAVLDRDTIRSHYPDVPAC